MTEVRIPWPNWEISELLGSGGFGTVYSIINQITGEESAVKVIPIPKEKSEIDSLRLEGYDDHSASERYKEQLDKIIDEYKIMARMKSHPHVVRCEDCAYTHHEDGIGWDVFIRMEKLVSLPKLLGKIEQDLAPEEVPRLGIDLCSALEMCQDMNTPDTGPEWGLTVMGILIIIGTIILTSSMDTESCYFYRIIGIIAGILLTLVGLYN